MTLRQCYELAMRADIVRRSVKVALLIGTMLTAINQGDILLGGAWLPEFCWKIPLTYVVPYCVSTFASVQAVIAREEPK